jgi:UDP-N-acetylmuramate--alanine ligase
MGVPDEKIVSGFNGFAGVKRRFTKVGEIVTDEGVVTVIDDYAHHPVEIRAVLSAAREGAGAGRVVAVVQPHRFTRLRDHMDDFQQAFNDADMVLALPVYAAGESPIEGVSSDALVRGLRDRGHRQANVVADADALAASLAASIKAGDLGAGDMIICLGAGDITKMAAGLASAVEGAA